MGTRIETKTEGMEKNMTAKVSCFARAYHYRNNEKWIFADTLAADILGTDYENIAAYMVGGISFFNPEFKGTKEDALRWIVDHQLSPSVLGRSAFCERMILSEIRLGCRQYLIFGAGYDTFAYRNNIPDLKVFELDRAELLADKRTRLCRMGVDTSLVESISCDFEKGGWKEALFAGSYDADEKSFCSMLGLSYYMAKSDFEKLLQQMSEIFSEGSAIVFDYQVQRGSAFTKKNEELAATAGESMKASYDYKELEKMLERCGLLIYEHLDDAEMTKQYFEAYNICYPGRKMYAPKGVEYCMAVKKQKY